MTHLGVGSYALAWAIGVPQNLPPIPMDTFTFLNSAASLGVNLVQIADNLPLHSLSPTELTRVKRESESLKINIEVGTRGIHIEHLQTYLHLAEEFESPILRIVVDTPDHHPSPSEIVSTLKLVLPAYEKAHVTLAIENHDRFKVQTLAEIIRQLESVLIRSIHLAR